MYLLILNINNLIKLNIKELKGKYRLSSSKKKIFDITELKSYCGSDCMISSRYYASQLLDEPVYLRNLET